MLKKFTVSNFKNFEKDLTLDLTSSNYEFNDSAVIDGVVKNSIIYGYNGSGKSNIVKAMMDITTHLTDFEVDHKRDSHYLCLNSKEEYASFKYTFNFEGKELIYSYKKKNSSNVFDEKILIDSKKVLVSEEKSLSLRGAENLVLDYDSSISFVKYVNSNTILDNEDTNVIVFKKFVSFVKGMLSFNSLEGNTYQGLEKGSEPLNDIILKHGDVHEFQEFLKAAGVNYTLRISNINGDDRIVVVWENDKEVDIFNVASKGTKALILFYTWLLKFDKVSMVFMDEFDSYYHNDLTKFVINKVKESGVQSLFSSHNTSVMSNDILRPDCYFILKNNKISSLDKTTTKELRRAHNLEKMYKAGAFKNV